jgi:hypothetical protein
MIAKFHSPKRCNHFLCFRGHSQGLVLEYIQEMIRIIATESKTTFQTSVNDRSSLVTAAASRDMFAEWPIYFERLMIADWNPQLLSSSEISWKSLINFLFIICEDLYIEIRTKSNESDWERVFESLILFSFVAFGPLESVPILVGQLFVLRTHWIIHRDSKPEKLLPNSAWREMWGECGKVNGAVGKGQRLRGDDNPSQFPSLGTITIRDARFQLNLSMSPTFS